MKIHFRGIAVTIQERAIHSCLRNKLWHHTSCGYLFDDTKKNRERVSFNINEVTCKLCLKKEND